MNHSVCRAGFLAMVIGGALVYLASAMQLSKAIMDTPRILSSSVSDEIIEEEPMTQQDEPVSQSACTVEYNIASIGIIIILSGGVTAMIGFLVD